MKRQRKFVWTTWNFDCEGDAYIIAKAECPNRENVPDYICNKDNLAEECKPEMNVQEGWARWEVRRDWEDGDGEPIGWHYFGS